MSHYSLIKLLLKERKQNLKEDSAEYFDVENKLLLMFYLLHPMQMLLQI